MAGEGGVCLGGGGWGRGDGETWRRGVALNVSRDPAPVQRQHFFCGSSFVGTYLAALELDSVPMETTGAAREGVSPSSLSLCVCGSLTNRRDQSDPYLLGLLKPRLKSSMQIGQTDAAAIADVAGRGPGCGNPQDTPEKRLVPRMPGGRTVSVCIAFAVISGAKTAAHSDPRHTGGTRVCPNPWGVRGSASQRVAGRASPK